ncbi:copper amine oxidase N-terminal domain-containing protein [Solibacillus sp. FSL W7-1464]|uniref:copper amine oxidase N-terminal domain-containing protein n=1 Tax=Solibacillus sp. FSL W7-1464 TaxID=2921706 RepID=UPI0030FCD54F
MKKIAPLALSVLLLGTVTAYAEQPTAEGTEEVEKTGTFIQHRGNITAVEERENAKLYTAEQDGNVFNFYVDDKTLVFDEHGSEVKLKIGDMISLSIYADQPMILIYPPQYAPSVVIVEKDDTANSVKVAQFDENFLSDDGELKLHLDEKSVIINAKGKKVPAKELKNYNAIVFYGPTTKSIPAQAAPEKIVVFPKLEEEAVNSGIASEIREIIGEDYKEVDGKVMVPLRIIAEELGFKVAATGNGAIISKGALSYTITRGEKTYGHNRALKYFDVAPALLEKNKTYVEYDFVKELLN